MQCEHWATYNANGTGTYTGSIPFTVFHAKPSTHVPLTSPDFSSQPYTTVGVSLSFSPLYNCYCPDYGTLTFIFQSMEHNICYCSPGWPFGIRNPGKGGLYHAMLAHAATHVVQLGSRNLQHMKRIAMQNQTIAINKLRESIELDRRDYEYFITTILTLMLVDVSYKST
jgi:hypothetical protein